MTQYSLVHLILCIACQVSFSHLPFSTCHTVEDSLHGVCQNVGWVKLAVFLQLLALAICTNEPYRCDLCLLQAYNPISVRPEKDDTEVMLERIAQSGQVRFAKHCNLSLKRSISLHKFAAAFGPGWLLDTRLQLDGQTRPIVVSC